MAKWYSQLKPIRTKLQSQNLHWWPNGTPNSSQLESSYNIKTCIGGGPNDTTKSSQLARNRLIVWTIRPCSHITTTKQLGESWLEITEVAANRVENLAPVGRKFEFDQSQAKWVAKRYPTPSKLWTWLELAWVGRTVWPGLKKALKNWPLEFPIWAVIWMSVMSCPSRHVYRFAAAMRTL